MKFHLSLNVADIGRSVSFYEKVFGTPPAKHRADYAKFEVAEPPLVLSLEPTPPAGRGSLNHVGLRLADTAALVEMQRRLELAGLRSEREEGVECCYAKQTKFWLHSPDGVLWEFYVLQGDITHRGAGQAPETLTGQDTVSPSPSSPLSPSSESWEHRMTEPFPASLPFADGSLSEVRLRGTFNTPDGEARRDEILAETKRVLAPGGRIALHLLTTDRSLAEAPSLPGPASAVKEVPIDTDLLASLERSGFADIRLTKFGPNPCFRLGGAEMRETMAEAFAPADETDGAVLVVYRGPFREVTADGDRVFRRGERVRVPLAEWERLSASLPVDTFTRLAEPETAVP
ncbi:MAG: VOC family protein, partial [Planctomycetaceae bacterium]|nr:VOC family protein [Planctomycetaceae bacterium]